MLRTTLHRILATLVVSLLIHLAFLFAPLDIRPPEFESPPLPTLTAKLVALPKIAPVAKLAVPPTPKPQAVKQPAASENVAVVEAISAVEATSAVMPTASVEAAPVVESAAASVIMPASSVASPLVAEPAPETAAPPLPKHAQLRFLITTEKGFQVGEAKHRLEVDADQHYILKTSINTTGVFSLIKIYDLEEISTGTLNQQGLQPDEYQVNKRTGKGKESYKVVFNRAEKVLEFSMGTHTELPARTQDLLSALYQVSQLPLSQGKVAVPVTNGKKLEYYEFTVGTEQPLVTRLGTLRALPLRKVHSADEEGLEIWLGLEYRLLPIKFISIDRAGKTIAEMVISEIRVGD